MTESDLIAEGASDLHYHSIASVVAGDRVRPGAVTYDTGAER